MILKSSDLIAALSRMLIWRRDRDGIDCSFSNSPLGKRDKKVKFRDKNIGSDYCMDYGTGTSSHIDILLIFYILHKEV